MYHLAWSNKNVSSRQRLEEIINIKKPIFTKYQNEMSQDLKIFAYKHLDLAKQSSTTQLNK